MKIFIPKELTDRADINQYELLVYCYLKILCPLQEIDLYHLDINDIIYAIYHKTDVGQRIRENIYDALNNMIETGSIAAERSGKTRYIVKTDSLQVDVKQSKFIIADSNDIRTIMASRNMLRASLVRYYIYLMRTINADIKVYGYDGKSKKNVVGNQTQDYIAYIMRSSVHTIRRYNKLLEEMKVIYIHRANDFILTDDGLRQLNNMYGRYTDREYIDKYAESLKEQMHSYNHFKPRLDEANNKRRLSKMYFWLCKGKEYHEDEVREIYEYVVADNKMYRNLAKAENDTRYLEKLKGETVFTKYPFLF